MKGIVVVVTYNCNIMCSNCSLGCGPHRKGVMSPEYFRRKVTEAYGKGYSDYVEISGGEPFLHTGIIFKYLKKIKGLKTKRIIVTNGFWGRMDYYIDILNALKESGIDELIFEYDSFHSVFIDENTILEAARKTAMCGIKYKIRAGFMTSTLDITYDIKTLEIIKNMRSKSTELLFECETQEKYKGLYSREKDAYRLIILP